MRKLGLAIVALAIAGVMAAPAWADHKPANKVAVGASIVKIIRCTTSDFPTSEGCVTVGSTPGVELLSGTFRSSAPTDLIIQVTLECALWTSTKVSGNGNDKGPKGKSEAQGSVLIWVEIDGDADLSTKSDNVAVSPTADDDGSVVFCDRLQTLDVDLEDVDENDFIELFIRTRSANGFNWVALDVGSAIHTVKVFAAITVTKTGCTDCTQDAAAAIGKRTLVVQPAKLANDATF